MHRDDILSPDERFREVAAILAAGLLRLKKTWGLGRGTWGRSESHLSSSPSPRPSAPCPSPKSHAPRPENPLECPAENRLHVPKG